MRHIPFSYSQRYCSYTGGLPVNRNGKQHYGMGGTLWTRVGYRLDGIMGGFHSNGPQMRACMQYCYCTCDMQYGYCIWIICDIQYCYYMATM